MRAPARAQDLILAHRVKDYRAGELERAAIHAWRLKKPSSSTTGSCLARPWRCCQIHARQPSPWDAWDARMQARAQGGVGLCAPARGLAPRDVQAHFSSTTAA